MHWPIMETLCAYIRENAGKPKPPPDALLAILTKPDRHRHHHGARETIEQIRAESDVLETFERDRPSVDVQAAITVIGRRSAGQLEYERARREDQTSKNADAWRLDLSNCHLAVGNFIGLDFTAARFTGSSLYLSNFWGAALAGAKFAKGHLEGASFNKAQLEGAGFGEANLEGAWFNSADLEGAGFSEAHLDGAWLHGAHLEGASFREARLENAFLNKAHFEGATLDGANLKGASLGNAVLVDARLDGADLGKAESVAQAQIEVAWGAEDTVLPDNCSRPCNERWRPDNFVDVVNRNDRWKARQEFWRAATENRLRAVAISSPVGSPQR